MMIRLLTILVFFPQLMIAQNQDNYFWAVARTWPIPMPITNSSSILPHLFLKKCIFDLPCKQADDQETPYNETSYNLVGTLCLTSNNSATLFSCLMLEKKELVSYLDPLRGITNSIVLGAIKGVLAAVSNGQSQGSGNISNDTAVNVTTYILNVTASFLFAPQVANNSSESNYTLPMPRCEGKTNFLWPPAFVNCIPRRDKPQPTFPGWWLWKNSKTPERKGIKNVLLTSPWIYSNERGGFIDLSPFLLFNSSKWVLTNSSGVLNNSFLRIQESMQLANISKGKQSVCVDPPFLWILSNHSTDDILNCSTTKCVLSQCWSFKHTTGMLAKMPTYVWVPVKADPNDFPVLSLIRKRRDFGITAAIVAAIVVSATAATTAAIAMANQVQTAATINTVVHKTSEALIQQELINKHLASGILLLNKRVDIIEDSLYKMFDVMSMSCIFRQEHLCVTPYVASLNDSRQLSNYLKGNWSMEFEQMQNNLTLKILSLNATKAEMVTLGEFTDWLVSAFSYLKEWAGVGVFGVLICAGLMVALFLIIRVMRARRREKVALVRALAALEAGTSPQAWLSLLKEA